MSDFKIGQLVACRQAACAEWLLGIFDGEKDGRLYVRPPLSLTCASKKSEWFSQVEPAEHIWPGVFMACDREIIDSLQKERDRLQQAIGWLCGQINRLSQNSGNCLLPAGAGIPSDDSCRVGGCEICWEQASLKAVEEDADD